MGAEKFESTVLVGKKEMIKSICSDAEAAASIFGFVIDPAMVTAMLDSVDGPTGEQRKRLKSKLRGVIAYFRFNNRSAPAFVADNYILI